MKHPINLLVALSITLCSLSSLGQQFNFTSYGLEQGLPQSTVFEIFEDQRGYLWIGTESGVARFNGTEFTVFDRSSGLPGNIVRSITQGPNGNIWVGTDGGIGVYNGASWSTITSANGLSGSAVLKLRLDHKDRIWAATNDAGVNVITITTDSLSILNIDKDSGLAGNFVLDILHDKKGKTWLALIGGINMIILNDNLPTIHSLEDSLFLPSNLISTIDIDREGNLWCGSLDAGVFQIKMTQTPYEIAHYGSAKGIYDNRIWRVLCDDSGKVWIGSNEKGLYYIENGVTQSISTTNGLPGNLVLSLYPDSNGNLWVGTMNGLSLFQGFHLMHYTESEGIPGKQVLAVKSAPDNSLWIGTDGKGLAKLNLNNNRISAKVFGPESGFTGKPVISMDFDSDGTLLAGTRGDGLGVYQNGSFQYIKASNGLANNNVNCVAWNEYGSIYVGTNLGYNEIKDDRIYYITTEDGLVHPEVSTIISDPRNVVWMGTMGGLVRFEPSTGNYRDFSPRNGLLDVHVNALAVDKHNQIYVGTSNGIFIYNERTDTITPFLGGTLNARSINALLFYNDSTLLAATTAGFNRIVYNRNLTKVLHVKQYDKTNGFRFSETNFNAITKDRNSNVWFGTVDGLTRYQPLLEDSILRTPKIHIKGVRLSFEPVDWKGLGYDVKPWFNIPQNLNLKYYQNHITFDFDGIYLSNPERVQYRYRLEPFDKNWSPPTKGSSTTYPGLYNGKYTFVVSASADGVNWSEPLAYQFIISPPFWKTLWFLIVCILTSIALIAAYIRYRERKLKKEKEHLEQVVKERTAEVVAQKDQIEKQHAIVTAQKHEITSSISYASRIQQAILPNADYLRQNTADSFILYKPRDIVSGDYYWFGKNGNKLIVAAADCTGHGVPGAFMSMLGISFMNKIINEQKTLEPNEILEKMRSNVIESLHQGNYAGTTKDGMDMALCVINLETLEMTFAGAYNPAVLISNNEAIEIKADRMPVGLHIKMDQYTSESVQLKKGDCIYLFSDGYQDQMGGPDGRKFMRKNLRALLLEIHTKPFAEQQEILEKTIEEWRVNPTRPDNSIDQIDDIVIVGFAL